MGDTKSVKNPLTVGEIESKHKEVFEGLVQSKDKYCKLVKKCMISNFHSFITDLPRLRWVLHPWIVKEACLILIR